MAFIFKLTLSTHAGGRRRRLSPLLRLAAACCYLLLLPLSGSSSSSVVRHLPGFDGPLPFYLETGYVGVDDGTGTELFYYFVESERRPRTDPVLLWLTGGPRCTVFSGLAFEVGPIKFVLAPYTPHGSSLPQLVYNPYSWTQMASILFVDSPVGSGFSYARDPKDYDVGDYSSSLQIVTFLKQWFIDHPQYLSNIFYIGGDSYAGKVIPLIAQYISEGIEERRQPRINLKGYLVGNPITDPRFDKNSVIPAAHGFGIISDQLYEAAVEHCKGDYVNPANKLCAEVLLTINDLLAEIQKYHILYDLCPPKLKYNGDSRRVLSEESIQLNEPPDRPKLHCFQYHYYLAYYWMNNNTTRDALGIKKGTVGEWIRCIKELPYAKDLPSSIKYHLNLTTRGYRALVYSGDHDLTVPFLGTQAWIRSLNFSIVDDWRAWHLNGHAAGVAAILLQNSSLKKVSRWLKGGWMLLSEISKAHILYDLCPVATPKPKYNGDSRRVLSEESVQLNEPPERPKLHCLTYGYYLAYYWMNNDTTRDALGVKEGTIGEWIRCIKGLPYTGDLPSSIKYHLNLTTRGYRALVYSGDHDLTVPFLGTQAWIRSLNFSIVDDRRAWHLNGQAVGFTITYANNLTFATLKGGGHTTPEYQPEESFVMAKRWLDGEPLKHICFVLNNGHHCYLANPHVY